MEPRTAITDQQQSHLWLFNFKSLFHRSTPSTFAFPSHDALPELPTRRARFRFEQNRNEHNPHKQTNKLFPAVRGWFSTLMLHHEPLCCIVVKCHARRLLSPLQRCVAPCCAVCACGVRAQRMLVRCALGDVVQGCSDVDMNRVNRPPPGMPLHSCTRWILHAAAAACASVP